MPNNFTAHASTDPLSDVSKDTEILSVSLLETPPDVRNHDADAMVKDLPIENGVKDVTSSTNGEISIENTTEGPEKSTSPSTDGVEFVNGHHPVPADVDPKATLANEDFSFNIKQGNPESEMVEIHSNSSIQEKDVEVLPETLPNPTKQQEHITETSPMRVQDQLDEAQGLLKSAISTGQSKEARLARVCAGLSSRLQEYKFENSQLEVLLVAERERSNSFEARVKQLQHDLSVSKIAVNKIESNMGDALAAKNSEIEALVSSNDALKKQAAVSEGKLASLQGMMQIEEIFK
ncbi:golgin-84-like [Tasmannia lanceolata]|uniref:golgin-84-like n=1 Tax=Tasmannia lanceolata TaxID=3420 RepID=UPI004064307D